MEAELESEEPTEMGGDATTFEDEGDRGIIVTLVERHEPTTASASGGRDAKRHGDVPTSRKRTACSDAAAKREVKRARSPCPLEALLDLPSCSKHGGACQPVRGACPYPRIFGVSVCTRATTGRCPVCCLAGEP